MAGRKPHAAHLAGLSGKQKAFRATLFLSVLLSLSMLVMSRAQSPAMERLRGGITDMLAPVLEIVASPMNAVANVGTWFTDIVHMRSENVALKNQNLQLLEWQAAAKEMEAENASLRALLKVVPARGRNYVTARVVGDISGPYVHSALINGGSENGIQKDQAVINENGLVGRVVDAGKTSARVLLLSDINSRVPVVTERSHEKSILIGNNNDLPTLSYLAATSHVEVGERVVTSGDGGIFPPGIPVGVVTSLEKGAVTVQPFVDPSKIEYISAVDYSL